MSLEQFVMRLINTTLQKWVKKTGNGEFRLRLQLLTLMNQLDKAAVVVKLDLCLQEILAFEAYLAKKLNQ